MKHEFQLERKPTNLPSEKLYEILRKIYPKDIAEKLYTELTGLEPPKEET